MKTVLYIGGVGGSATQAGEIAAALALHFNANAFGMSLADAWKRPGLVARLARESLVITHSTGMLALRGMSPKELIAIAPPMPSHPLHLFGRVVSKTLALAKSGRESRQRRSSIRKYHINSVWDFLLRPLHIGMNLPAIGKFDAAAQAVTLAGCGAKVTLVLMENDRLFPYNITHPHIDTAEENGVRIVRHTLGHHDEFLLCPLDVLALIGR